MDANQKKSSSNDDIIKQLQQQLADAHSQIAERDAQLADAHAQLDDLHALIEEHSLVATDDAKITAALTDAETLRDTIISWLVSGEELTTAERHRMMGSGVRRLGFIVKVLEMMQVNPELAPDFLDREHFEHVVSQLQQSRNLTTVLQQAARLSGDVLLILGNEAYRMALVYYGAVREAANRRVPGARELFRTLQAFFRRGRRDDEEAPTEEEILRDLKALMHHRKDGEISVVNESDKVIKGKHVVVDETHKAKGAWKETESGEVEE
jgi:hypothetical protein